MCGITGVYRFRDGRATPETVAAVQAMGEAQRHRGPDDAGLAVLGRCVLGSQRLSILDLSERGHMPMSSDDGLVSLVHNGEIYNYVELRSELAALGHRFRSDGDTEVIVRAYQEWGPGCVERFVGMWAFALYDARHDALLLSRDRFGIKPLYLRSDANEVAFASEIKALVAYSRASGHPVQVDDASVATYVTTGQVDGLPNTFFRGIARVPAGTSTWLRPAGAEPPRAYWSLEEGAARARENLRGRPAREAFAAVRQSLDEAVRVHLRSDVPVGVCLSGGLDSSAVVGLAAPRAPSIETFTVYFQDGPEFDERREARAAARQFAARSNEQPVPTGDLLPALKRIIWHLDEPALAPGTIPQWHVMQLAASRVKVVLDGQGGDEVFAGYLNYLPQRLYGLLWGNLVGFATEAAGIARVHGLSRAHAAARSAVAMRLHPPVVPQPGSRPDAALLAPELRDLADVSFEEWRLWPRVFDDWLANILYWELTRTRLPALLRYEDRLSMAFSIESRVPFLDHRLVELAFALPDAARVHQGWTKYAARMALDGLLPKEVVWRRDKKGFPTPVGRWLADQRGAEARALLCDPGRATAPFFSQSAVERALSSHVSGQDRSAQLWRALNVELWHRAFFP